MIGILTFHRATNYGALLQTYGLSRFIQEKLNADNEIIDYRNLLIEEQYHFSLPKRFNRDYVRRIYNLFYYRKRNQKFKSFLTKLNISNISYTRDTINMSNKRYDFFIVGSDQVFNPELTDNDTTYYLDFVSSEAVKFSYAASFGNGVSSDLLKRRSVLLCDFDGLSIREYSDFLKYIKTVNSSAHNHMDPSFLLTKEEWKRFVSRDLAPRKDKYIFVYEMHRSLELDNYILKLQRELGYSVFVLSNCSKKNRYDWNLINEIGIEEFLSTIYYSEYIVTNSFHGTVFSVIFEKLFHSVIFENSKITNDRAYELLKMLSIDEYVIDENIVLWDDGFYKEKEVNKVLNNKREESKVYLMSLLSK